MNARNLLWQSSFVLAGLLIVATAAQAQLYVDFDGGGNTAYSPTSTTGEFSPTVMADGPTGNYMRVVDISASNNNSVALDEVANVSGPAPNGKILSFDFRMSDNQTNIDSGGCCNSAADGFGIGYFATPLYGATGPSNPAGEEGASAWERPVFASAAVIGFDIFEDIDEVSLNFFGMELASVDVRPMGLDLNNNVFHRGIFTVEPDPADAAKAIFSIDVVEDINGASPITHNVLTDFPVDIDLNTLPANRVIFGGRTGAAWVNADLDNISVNYIPEPTSLSLLSIASLALLMVRRRRTR